MKTVVTTKFRNNLYQLLREVIHSHEPLQILDKEGSLVVISKEDWESLEETLYLHSVPGVVDKIKEGSREPIEQCTNLDDIEWWNSGK